MAAGAELSAAALVRGIEDGVELFDEGGHVDPIELSVTFGQYELLLARPLWLPARRRPRR
jgi:hypothetical protein